MALLSFRLTHWKDNFSRYRIVHLRVLHFQLYTLVFNVVFIQIKENSIMCTIKRSNSKKCIYFSLIA